MLLYEQCDIKWYKHRWFIGDTHKNCTVKTQSSFVPLGPATRQVEFVPSRPLTPRAHSHAKVTTWHSFSRPVWICMGGKEGLSWRCRSITVVFAPALRSITDDPQHVRRVAWICLIFLWSRRGARVAEYREVHVVRENSDTSFSHPSFSHYIH